MKVTEMHERQTLRSQKEVQVELKVEINGHRDASFIQTSLSTGF